MLTHYYFFSVKKDRAGTVGGQEEEFSRTVANPSGGQKGTCPGEGDSDGGLVRHTERALRPEASQGPDEADGNPVHLLRHPHGKRGAAGGQDRAESTAGGLVKRKHALGNVLSQGNYASVREN